MTKTLKDTGETVQIVKQFRNQSNNYKEDTKIYADLFEAKYKGSKRIFCETELAQ